MSNKFNLNIWNYHFSNAQNYLFFEFSVYIEMDSDDDDDISLKFTTKTSSTATWEILVTQTECYSTNRYVKRYSVVISISFLKFKK